MRRLLLAVICGVLLLSSASPALAGWGHVSGWHHVGRHYAHYHRHYYHGHRHYYRSYVPRYYAYRYSYPSFSFSYGYFPRPYYSYPTRYYYSYPARYYTPYRAPYCASIGPTYYDSGFASALTGGARSVPSSAVAGRPSMDLSPLATVAERLIREVAATRSAPGSTVMASTLGTAPATSPHARATSLIEKGDEHFRAEQYDYALAYYEAAAKTDTTAAAAHFRQGLCGIATSHYNDAANAFRRGVDADPSFLTSTFRLKQVYVSDEVRTQHVEALAGTALENTDDPTAFFLIGAFLHFEGTPERAQKFLRRASNLSGDDVYAREFLAASRRSQPLVMTSGLSPAARTGSY